MRRTGRVLLGAIAVAGAVALAPAPAIASGQCVGMNTRCQEVPFTYWNGFEWVNSSFWLYGIFAVE